MNKIALILDLDNTLYNWMDAYASGLNAQIDYISKFVPLTKKKIENKFKKVFLKYGEVEVLYAVYELEFWKYLTIQKDQRKRIQKKSLEIFFQNFNKELKLYPTVKNTLIWAKQNQIKIFALSDAYPFFVHHRLKKCHIENIFDKIYVTKDKINLHVKDVKFLSNMIILPSNKSKPSPYTINEIKKDYHLKKENMFLVGDNIAKDIECAKKAEITSILVQYKNSSKSQSRQLLSKVTPWKKSITKKLVPDFKIEEFQEIKKIIYDKIKYKTEEKKKEQKLP